MALGVHFQTLASCKAFSKPLYNMSFWWYCKYRREWGWTSLDGFTVAPSHNIRSRWSSSPCCCRETKHILHLAKVSLLDCLQKLSHQSVNLPVAQWALLWSQSWSNSEQIQPVNWGDVNWKGRVYVWKVGGQFSYGGAPLTLATEISRVYYILVV